MSRRSQPIGAVPGETARVARAPFPRGNLSMRMRDELGTIFTGAAFASLFAARGRPAEALWRLALSTILQYAEGLSDRQAADAVRSRIDWQTAAYQAESAKRAGVEGTISYAVRVCGLRRARYTGVVKTHLQHVLTAAAINFIRLGRWLAGDRPTQARITPFVALMKRATPAA
jgi:Transposase DDE domain/Transposase domain (DUF772)